MFKKFYFIAKIFFLFLGAIFVLFLGVNKACAVDTPSQKVVINELMWMGSSIPESGQYDEWIELRNMTQSEISLEGWRITKNTGTETNIDINFEGKFLPANGYFLISCKNVNSILAVSPDVQTTNKLFLSNSKLKITLYDSHSKSIDVAGNGGTPLLGSYLFGNKWESMERNYIPGNGTELDNWHTAVNSTGFILGATEKGTPGTGIPQSVILEDPEINSNTVLLIWSQAENDDFLKYEIYLSEESGKLGKKIGDIQEVENNSCKVEELGVGIEYFFTIRNYNLAGNYSDSNQALAILPIIYSKNIIINEILPHPENGTDNEFIELYNSGNEEVDLSGWFLDDGEGGSTSFLIPNETKIGAKKYLVFYKKQTKISLNDAGDTARLLYPNKKLACTISYSNADLGLSWAKGSNGSWSWTTKITPRAINEIILPTNEEESDSDEIDIPINSEPVEIATGEFQNFENYLVTVEGEVIETSGDTFYIDDGTGVAKIYIQSKTGIKKPPMRTGDVFRITGIVNLYRDTWRILPRTVDDIKLITPTLTVKQAKAKQTVKKAATKVVSTLKPKSGAVGQVKAAENSNNENQSSSTKEPTWLQFAEFITSLSFIFLVILIVKIKMIKRPKIIGGKFGDDFT